MKSVMHQALADIQNELPKRQSLDVWYVRPNHLLNKRTRYLNALLGINKINY